MSYGNINGNYLKKILSVSILYYFDVIFSEKKKKYSALLEYIATKLINFRFIMFIIIRAEKDSFIQISNLVEYKF